MELRERLMCHPRSGYPGFCQQDIFSAIISGVVAIVVFNLFVYHIVPWELEAMHLSDDGANI